MLTQETNNNPVTEKKVGEIFPSFLLMNENSWALLEFLSPEDLSNLAQVSHGFRSLVSKSHVWRRYMVNIQENEIVAGAQLYQKLYETFRNEKNKRQTKYINMRYLEELRRSTIRIPGEEFKRIQSKKRLDQAINLLRDTTIVSIRKAEKLSSLINDFVPVNRVIYLHNQGKTTDEILQITDLDLLKFAYQRNNRIFLRQLLATLVFIGLFLAFREAVRKNSLDQELAHYDGNMPIKPNLLTSMMPGDYCNLMKKSGYDTSNCNNITDQYKSNIYVYLFILMCGFASISALMIPLRLYLTSARGLKFSICMHYLLPECIYPLPKNLETINQPLINYQQKIYGELVHCLITTDYQLLILIFAPLMLAVFVIVAAAYCKFYYEARTDTYQTKRLIFTVCSTTGLNASEIWEACKTGNYPYNTTTQEIGEYCNTNEIGEYCNTICHTYANYIYSFSRWIPYGNTASFVFFSIIGLLLWLAPFALDAKEMAYDAKRSILGAESVNPYLLFSNHEKIIGQQNEEHEERKDNSSSGISALTEV